MGGKQQIVITIYVRYACNLCFPVSVWSYIIKAATVCSDSLSKMHRRPSTKPPRQKSEGTASLFSSSVPSVILPSLKWDTARAAERESGIIASEDLIHYLHNSRPQRSTNSEARYTTSSDGSDGLDTNRRRPGTRRSGSTCECSSGTVTVSGRRRTEGCT